MVSCGSTSASSSRGTTTTVRLGRATSASGARPAAPVFSSPAPKTFCVDHDEPPPNHAFWFAGNGQAAAWSASTAWETVMNEEPSSNVENFGKLPGEPLSANPTPVWSDRAHPLLAEEGKPWNGLGTIADLTEGMGAEAALRENDARPAAENTALAKLNEL